MLSQLTGVVRSGGRPSLRVPPDSRQGLAIVGGMSNDILVTVVDQQGTAVDLFDATLTLTVRRSPRDLSPLLAVQGVNVPEQGANLAVFSLPGDQTGSWRTTGYCYDIVLLRSSGDLEAIVPTSPLYLTPSVYGGTASSAAPAQLRGTVPAPGGPYPAIPVGTPVGIVDEIVLVIADASNPATMPCVGLYTGAASNLVRTDGAFEGLVGLPENVPLFVAVGGGFTDVPPTGIGQSQQRIGKSIGTTNAFLELGPSVRLT
jgi:hypothetical protein